MALIRWLARNLGTLLLALILALIVWVTAVTSADPNENRDFTLSLDILGQDPGMEIVGSFPSDVHLVLYAPSSLLDQLNKNDGSLSAWVDLSDLDSGTHNLAINYQLPPDIRPVRVVDLSPESIEITLEALITNTVKIQTDIIGDPALGYQVGTPEWSDLATVVSGRESLVQRVTNISVVLDISGENESVERSFNLVPRDNQGNQVLNVSLDPARITVSQPITLLGGYRNMVIKVLTTGQVADGYRQTSISVSPPNVLVFSEDPTLVNQLPGYIETEVLNLSGATDDIETVLALDLPEGVSVVGDPNVVVLVGVAAIEGSITITRPVEIIGLVPGLTADVSPENITLILSGPIPDLDQLAQLDVRVVLDLTGLETGVYQIAPAVEILPDRIQLDSASPETVEVNISERPTPTITPTSSLTPTATVTP